jgi:hypothetical protein
MIFPREIPPRRDFALWRKTLPYLRGHGRLHLGPILSTGHKVWDWKYDAEECLLYHQQHDNTDNIYQPSNLTGVSTRANAWELLRVNQARFHIQTVCTVEKIGEDGRYRITSYSDPVVPITASLSLRDVLSGWKCEWMWADLRLSGSDTWIAKAIHDNTLVAVTDGSQ